MGVQKATASHFPFPFILGRYKIQLPILAAAGLSPAEGLHNRHQCLLTTCGAVKLELACRTPHYILQTKDAILAIGVSGKDISDIYSNYHTFLYLY